MTPGHPGLWDRGTICSAPQMLALGRSFVLPLPLGPGENLSSDKRLPPLCPTRKTSALVFWVGDRPCWLGELLHHLKSIVTFLPSNIQSESSLSTPRMMLAWENDILLEDALCSCWTEANLRSPLKSYFDHS